MKIKNDFSINCISCGAPICDTKVCEYCGRRIVVDDDKNKLKHVTMATTIEFEPAQIMYLDPTRITDKG